MQNQFISKRKWSGQITVFLSLLMSVILLFFLTCTEGMYVYLGKGCGAQTAVAAGESVLADYNIFLWKNYRIFAVDEMYGQAGRDALPEKLQGYLDWNMPMVQFPLYSKSVQVHKKIYLTDEDGMVLRAQIAQFMKYQIEKDGVKAVFNRFSAMEDKQAITSARNAVEQSRQNADAAQETEAKKQLPDAKTKEEKKTSSASAAKINSQEDKNERITDPRDTLKQLLQGGIVELVTGRNDFSRIPYEKADLFKQQYDTKELEEEKTEKKEKLFQDSEEVTGRLQEKPAEKSLTNEMILEGLGIQYAVTYFTNAKTATAEEGAIKCQAEYLIAGKDTDYQNIKNVIYRIVAIRFPVDFAYAVTDNKLTAGAQTLATAIAGVSANPAVIEVVKYLLLASLSYAEAIADVRTLLQGGKVEFLKNASNWKLSFQNMGKSVCTKENDSQQGLSYEDYLRILLVMQTDHSRKYQRMLHVMQVQGQMQQEEFQIQNMICGFQAQIRLGLPGRFCNMVPFATARDGDYVFSYRKYFAY